jgi:POT family proton-dependent oligopeptide transporter
VVRDRLIVIGILSFASIFFWMAFEQAGGSMNIFAKDYTSRLLTGSAARAFFWVDALLTLIPLGIVTWVLFRLVAATHNRIALSNACIVLSFVIIWGAAAWRLNREFNMRSYDVDIAPMATVDAGGDGSSGATVRAALLTESPLKEGDSVFVVDLEGKAGSGKLRLIPAEQADAYTTRQAAVVTRDRGSEIEVTASWFQILNSFFIIALAPLVGRIWETRLNPSAPVKFGLGLILLGTGFAVLALASMGVDKGAKTANLSMWWLVITYLFHTVGELFVSPVGLSYVSKLAPARLVGLMFGIWFLASAIANYLAGMTGGMIDSISERYGLAGFFLIYTCIPAVAGVILIAASPRIRRMMHGIG